MQNKKNDIISNHYEYDIVSEPKKHCFFGYYDLSPFQNNTNNILNIVTDGYSNKACINLYDIKTKKNNYITDTHIWNWQQGCRLRWYPSRTDIIMFNDCLNNQYCCQVFDIINKKVVDTIGTPLYDVDKTGRFGLTLDFARLGYKRPGYGYSLLGYDENKESIREEGIDLVMIKDHNRKRLVSYEEIVRMLHLPEQYEKYYINHLSFSPSGNKFLFFFLDSSTERHEAYMLVYDIKNCTVKPLESHDKVSHYTWLSDNEILATVYDDNMKCHYLKYIIDEQKRILFNDISEDGHPSLCGGIILTDTYPDHSSFQHLSFVDGNGIVERIADIYSNPIINGEKRTDLHPRININHSYICVDYNSSKYRNICVFSKK